MWESLVVNVNKNPDKWPEPLLQMNGFEWWVKQCLIMKWDLWQNNGLQMSSESKVKCYWRIRKNNQNTSKRGGLVQQSICCSVCRSKSCARDEIVRLRFGFSLLLDLLFVDSFFEPLRYFVFFFVVGQVFLLDHSFTLGALDPDVHLAVIVQLLMWVELFTANIALGVILFNVLHQVGFRCELFLTESTFFHCNCLPLIWILFVEQFEETHEENWQK